MKAKHTPMPWTTIRCEDGMEVLTHDAESICVVKHYGDPYNSKREEANARLIAAAPELLRVAELAATLNTQTNHIGSGMLAELVERARAAIAKATGNTL